MLSQLQKLCAIHIYVSLSSRRKLCVCVCVCGEYCLFLNNFIFYGILRLYACT